MIIENVKGLTKVSEDSLDIVTGGADAEKSYFSVFVNKMVEGFGNFLPQVAASVTGTLLGRALGNAIFDKSDKHNPENKKDQNKNQ